MDRVLYGDAVVGQLLGQLLERVLCPRDRKAVAWDDNHGVGVGQQEGGVISGAGLHRACFFGARRSASIRRVAETAQQHIKEGAVHRLAHDVRQDRAAGAHQGTGDDQHRVVQRETDARRCPAGIAIEHRHHHGHVGAANRDDDQHTQHEGQGQHQCKCAEIAGEHERQAQAQGCQAEYQVQFVLAAELYRCALEQAELVLARQLAECDHRAGEGDCTDSGTEEQFQAVTGRYRIAQVLDDTQGLRLDHGGNGDEHRCQADHAVHEGDQLGHLGHFNTLGHDRAGGTANQ